MHGRRLQPRSARALGALLVVLLSAAFTLLTSSAQAKGPIVVDAAQLLGNGSPAVDGWFTAVVRLTNTSDAQVEGNVELLSELSWTKDKGRIITRAPFAVAGKQQVSVRLPTHGFSRSPPTLTVRVMSTDGAELAAMELPEPRLSEPLLFDLNVPSRVAPGLRGVAVPVKPSAGSSYRGGAIYGAPLLNVSSPQVAAATGDPVLPERAPAYASVTVVLSDSKRLALVSGAELEALGSWVLAGGSLAVVITRPEDLRMPALVAMAGAEIRAKPAPDSFKGSSVFVVAPDPSSTSSSPHSSPSYPGSGGSFTRKQASPADNIVGQLTGYSGGNLRDSPWGASASYGLGEIHILGFDTTREEMVADEWVKLKLIDLVRHSWERRVTLAHPIGEASLDNPRVSVIRRQLDPNENTRWAIAVAALLLLAYSVFAGPVNFYLASRAGKPLRALIHLPIWAVAASLLVVVLGVLAKGVSGRARHLTLVESGAGMSRASALRFRGFFASSSDELTVRAHERNGVLDVTGDTDDTTRTLVIDRDGARLENFIAKPWQTVVVREDSFISLGGGISIIDAGGDAEIKNRVARDLLGVLVKTPGKDVVYFPRIKNGELVKASAGEKLSGKIIGTSSSGHLAVHRLGASVFTPTVNKASSGLGEAWAALDSYCGSDVDWWPDDVPVLLAQIEGGEGQPTDSGLRVDIDRTLIRVVGWGGVR